MAVGPLYELINVKMPTTILNARDLEMIADHTQICSDVPEHRPGDNPLLQWSVVAFNYEVIDRKKVDRIFKRDPRTEAGNCPSPIE